MNKFQTPIKIKHNKHEPIFKFALVLDRIEKSFTFRKISFGFAKILIFHKNSLHKIQILQKIRLRKVQDGYLSILSFNPKSLKKQSALSAIQKLSVSILIKFILRIEKKNKTSAFEKLLNKKQNQTFNNVQTFTKSIIQIFKGSQIKNFSSFLQKTKKIIQNENKLFRVNKIINNFIVKTKINLVTDSFGQISKISFSKIQTFNVKKKQEKLLDQRKGQIQKSQRISILKAQILDLTRSLQIEQSSKNKLKKQDHQKSVVIAAKSAQNRRTNIELQKCLRQNDVLKLQLCKIQDYIQNKSESKIVAQNSELNFQILHDLLSSQSTKQNYNFKQITTLLQRKNIDLNRALKNFDLSRENTMLENVDLKNLIILYEKEMNGFGSNVKITASEMYLKTFEQNQNLRELLECLILNTLVKDDSVEKRRNQVNSLIERHRYWQKGSEVTLVTSSSGQNG